MNSLQHFTIEQKSQLEPYVTNTESSVYVLTNLPEVIKGALFSRYSRSILGLRSLLLKEFILSEESEFSSIHDVSIDSGSRQHTKLAIERAKSFYDRILDGYGDDSIGELGGAHLALENLSMLATKVIEDARIGGSPLEKSTRYVNFSEKIDGNYAYYRDPKVMDSRYRQTYLDTCDYLFETYERLTKPVWNHVRNRMPREAGISETAYERSVKAKGFDLLRGLLPAAAQTNMGIYGNGRFFETLISKMHVESLSEVHELAKNAFTELSKVIPSFIRRADKEHPHFQNFEVFSQEKKALIKNFSREHQTKPSPLHQETEVRLVDYDPDAETRVIAGLMYPFTESSMEQLHQFVRKLNVEEKSRLLKESAALRKHRRHKPGRELELPYYTFDLLGDYGMYRDLQRHRMLTQERQPLSTRFGFEESIEISEAGIAGDFRKAMNQASEAYDTILEEFPYEAQSVVPLAYRIRWYVRINLRSLSWMTELRSAPQGHPGYRTMVQQMFLRVKEVHPMLAGFMKFVDLEVYPLGRLESEVRQETQKTESD